MENMNLELDEMRSQIAALKGKLEKQDIVTDRLIADAMHTKVERLSNVVLKNVIGAMVFIPLFVLIHFQFGISWPLVIVTSVLAVAYAIIVYCMHKPLMKKDLMCGNVAEVASTISRIKSMYANWFKKTWYIGLPWAAWFVYEYTQNNNASYLYVLVGAAIGLYFGQTKNKKNAELCDTILEQLSIKD